jgi:hypothetical protein
LSVVAATGSFPVQSPDPLATVPSFFEFGLQPGDFSCCFAEPVKQVSAFVQVLLAGRSGTGNDVVRTYLLQGENPVVYDGRESDNADTNLVQQQYGYLSRIVS